MWTTSSSRASAGAALLLAACLGPARPGATVPNGTPAPDAPRAAVTGGVVVQPPADTQRLYEPVELRSVAVTRLTSDTMLVRLAGRGFLEAAREPLALEVITERPLAPWGPNSSPEIYLNSERPGDTWKVGPSRLVVFLADRQRIRPINSVTVAWLGNEEATRSRRPLMFRAEELPR
jgi:hypothetical protein